MQIQEKAPQNSPKIEMIADSANTSTFREQRVGSRRKRRDRGKLLDLRMTADHRATISSGSSRWLLPSSSAQFRLILILLTLNLLTTLWQQTLATDPELSSTASTITPSTASTTTTTDSPANGPRISKSPLKTNEEDDLQASPEATSERPVLSTASAFEQLTDSDAASDSEPTQQPPGGGADRSSEAAAEYILAHMEPTGSPSEPTNVDEPTASVEDSSITTTAADAAMGQQETNTGATDRDRPPQSDALLEPASTTESAYLDASIEPYTHPIPPRTISARSDAEDPSDSLSAQLIRSRKSSGSHSSTSNATSSSSPAGESAHIQSSTQQPTVFTSTVQAMQQQQPQHELPGGNATQANNKAGQYAPGATEPTSSANAQTFSSLDYDDFDLDYQLKLNTSYPADQGQGDQTTTPATSADPDNNKRPEFDNLVVKPPEWSSLMKPPNVFESAASSSGAGQHDNGTAASAATSNLYHSSAAPILPSLLTVKSTQLTSQELNRVRPQFLLYQDEAGGAGPYNDQSLALAANGDLIATASNGGQGGSPGSVILLNGSTVDLREPQAMSAMPSALQMRPQQQAAGADQVTTIVVEGTGSHLDSALGSNSSAARAGGPTSQANQWFNYPQPNVHQNPLLLHHIFNKPALYAQHVSSTSQGHPRSKQPAQAVGGGHSQQQQQQQSDPATENRTSSSQQQQQQQMPITRKELDQMDLLSHLISARGRATAGSTTTSTPAIYASLQRPPARDIQAGSSYPRYGMEGESSPQQQQQQHQATAAAPSGAAIRYQGMMPQLVGGSSQPQGFSSPMSVQFSPQVSPPAQRANQQWTPRQQGLESVLGPLKPALTKQIMAAPSLLQEVYAPRPSADLLKLQAATGSTNQSHLQPARAQARPSSAISDEDMSTYVAQLASFSSPLGGGQPDASWLPSSGRPAASGPFVVGDASATTRPENSKPLDAGLVNLLQQQLSFTALNSTPTLGDLESLIQRLLAETTGRANHTNHPMGNLTQLDTHRPGLLGSGSLASESSQPLRGAHAALSEATTRGPLNDTVNFYSIEGHQRNQKKEREQLNSQLVWRQKQLAFVEALRAAISSKVPPVDLIGNGSSLFASLSSTRLPMHLNTSGSLLDELSADANATSASPESPLSVDDFDDQVSGGGGGATGNGGSSSSKPTPAAAPVNAVANSWRTEKQLIQDSLVHESARVEPFGRAASRLLIGRPPGLSMLIRGPALGPAHHRQHPAASALHGSHMPHPVQSAAGFYHQSLPLPLLSPARLQPLLRPQLMTTTPYSVAASHQQHSVAAPQPITFHRMPSFGLPQTTGPAGTALLTESSQAAPSLAMSPSRLIADRFPLASAPAYLIKLPTLTGGTITAAGSIVPPPRLAGRNRPLMPLRLLTTFSPPRLRLVSHGVLHPAPSGLQAMHQAAPAYPYAAAASTHPYQHHPQYLIGQQPAHQLGSPSLLQPVGQPVSAVGSPWAMGGGGGDEPTNRLPPPVPATHSNHHQQAPQSDAPTTASQQESSAGPSQHHTLAASGSSESAAGATMQLGATQAGHSLSASPLTSRLQLYQSLANTSTAADPLRQQQHSSAAQSPSSTTLQQASQSAGQQQQTAPSSAVGPLPGVGQASGTQQSSPAAALSRLQQATASLVELTSLASLVDEMVGGSDVDPSPAVAIMQALSSISQQAQQGSTSGAGLNTQASTNSNSHSAGFAAGDPLGAQQFAPLNQQQQPQFSLKTLLNSSIWRDKQLARQRELLLERLTSASRRPASARLRVKYIRVPVAVYESPLNGIEASVLVPTRNQLITKSQLAELVASASPASGAPGSAQPAGGLQSAAAAPSGSSSPASSLGGGSAAAAATAAGGDSTGASANGNPPNANSSSSGAASSPTSKTATSGDSAATSAAPATIHSQGALAATSSSPSADYLFDEALSSDSVPQLALALRDLAASTQNQIGADEDDDGGDSLRQQGVEKLEYLPLLAGPKQLPAAGVPLRTKILPLTSETVPLYYSMLASPSSASIQLSEPQLAGRSRNRAKKGERARKGRKRGNTNLIIAAEEADEEELDSAANSGSGDSSATDDDAITSKDLPILESLISTIIHGPQATSPTSGPGSGGSYFPADGPAYGGWMYGPGGAAAMGGYHHHMPRARPSPYSFGGFRGESSAPMESYVQASGAGLSGLSPFGKHSHRFSLGEVVGALGARKLISSLLNKRKRSRTSKRAVNHQKQQQQANAAATVASHRVHNGDGTKTTSSSSSTTTPASILAGKTFRFRFTTLAPSRTTTTTTESSLDEAHTASQAPPVTPISLWFPTSSEYDHGIGAKSGASKRRKPEAQASTKPARVSAYAATDLGVGKAVITKSYVSQKQTQAATLPTSPFNGTTSSRPTTRRPLGGESDEELVLSRPEALLTGRHGPDNGYSSTSTTTLVNHHQPPAKHPQLLNYATNQLTSSSSKESNSHPYTFINRPHQVGEQAADLRAGSPGAHIQQPPAVAHNTTGSNSSISAPMSERRKEEIMAIPLYHIVADHYSKLHSSGPALYKTAR